MLHPQNPISSHQTHNNQTQSQTQSPRATHTYTLLLPHHNSWAAAGCSDRGQEWIERVRVKVTERATFSRPHSDLPGAARTCNEGSWPRLRSLDSLLTRLRFTSRPDSHNDPSDHFAYAYGQTWTMNMNLCWNHPRQAITHVGLAQQLQDAYEARRQRGASELRPCIDSICNFIYQRSGEK